MDQETRWLIKYNEVKRFIEDNKRNPSKYVPEERLLVNWTKQQRKLVNKGEMRPERASLFKELLVFIEKYKRVNQWV